jgi:hypothetical protein
VLFDDISKNLENNKDVYDLMYSLIFEGKRKSFTFDNPAIEWCRMFGLISSDSERAVTVANKIFETRISNYFISKNENRINKEVCNSLHDAITQNGRFNM